MRGSKWDRLAQGRCYLRAHYQKRDRQRLIVDYRQRFLNSLRRGSQGEAKQAEEDYEKARKQTDKDYEETTATMAERKQLTTEETVELRVVLFNAGNGVQPFSPSAQGQAHDFGAVWLRAELFPAGKSDTSYFWKDYRRLMSLLWCGGTSPISGQEPAREKNFFRRLAASLQCGLRRTCRAGLCWLVVLTV